MKNEENLNNSQSKRQAADTNPKVTLCWNYDTKTFKLAVITML